VLLVYQWGGFEWTKRARQKECFPWAAHHQFPGNA
jgi:hypothetical protein